MSVEARNSFQQPFLFFLSRWLVGCGFKFKLLSKREREKKSIRNKFGSGFDPHSSFAVDERENEINLKDL